jgi:hypothetical protein
MVCAVAGDLEVVKQDGKYVLLNHAPQKLYFVTVAKDLATGKTERKEDWISPTPPAKPMALCSTNGHSKPTLVYAAQTPPR